MSRSHGETGTYAMRLQVYCNGELIAEFDCSERAADKAAQLLNRHAIAWKAI